MKPIILLAIVAVGAIALGTGFLAPIIPNMTVQNLGVGDRDLETPIQNAGVDLAIGKILDPVTQTWKNKFESCSFHSGDSPLTGPLDKVICKLTGVDANGNPNHKTIAEASLQFCTEQQALSQAGCPPGTSVWQPSQQYILKPLIEAYPGALQLDNVGDVRLVVLGDDPTDDLP